jgi:hypothetical protein
MPTASVWGGDCPVFDNGLLKTIVPVILKKKMAYNRYVNVKHISSVLIFFEKTLSSRIIDASASFIPNIPDDSLFLLEFWKKDTIKILYGAMEVQDQPSQKAKIYWLANINCRDICSATSRSPPASSESWYDSRRNGPIM